MLNDNNFLRGIVGGTLLLALGMVSPVSASDPEVGVVSRVVPVTLDGTEIATLRVGQTVSILGENDETKELLVSFSGGDGQAVVGLIPQGSVIIAGRGGSSLSPGGATHPAATPAPAAAELDFSRPVTAEQLGEFLAAHRQDFDRFRNQKLTISGTIGEAAVTGRGTSQQVSITFRMPSNLPKIKANMSMTYLNGEDFRKRFNFGQDYLFSAGQTVNFRSNREGVQAQVVWEKTYTYTSGSNRQYQSKSKSESAWIPILPAGSTVTLEGTLADFRFEALINDAQFKD